MVIGKWKSDVIGGLRWTSKKLTTSTICKKRNDMSTIFSQQMLCGKLLKVVIGVIEK